MTKFDLGEPVLLDNSIKGFIVRISIDPISSYNVAEELLYYTFYTVRVFADFYKDGYFDFERTENELQKI